MAETTTGTAAPRRNSRTRAAKPAVKAEETVPDGVSTEGDKTRVQTTLIKMDDTKNFAVFMPPKDSGCVGKFYAPLGTEIVKVLLIGPTGE